MAIEEVKYYLAECDYCHEGYDDSINADNIFEVAARLERAGWGVRRDDNGIACIACPKCMTKWRNERPA